MRNLSNTIARLAAFRATTPAVGVTANAPALTELSDFGDNPGGLRAWSYVPAALRKKPSLVVVLHGCTQTAADYNHGAGWSQLADEQGFVLLFPEQRRANNMNLCFNWYEPAHSRRDAGEPLSIRRMIEAMIARHNVDPSRVHITGLSAGGAMTSVMLATYPEIFAGGAIIAGLPYGAATNVPEAFDRMRGHGCPDAAALAAAIRAASTYRGQWPSIAVWHGSADRTVAASNAAAIVAQWRGVHGLPEQPDHEGAVDGHPHRVWRDPRGRPVIEHYEITDMGHGTPLATGGDDGCGASGAHMLEVGISSTRHIAASWGLARGGIAAAILPGAVRTHREPVAGAARAKSAKPGLGGVGKVIEDALRAAGLMR
ncbi:MAG: PHB depolymerase family esterase [Sphingomonas sp.]|jgi:poly(hydroxyalkanoate) depolymerase family esterase|uniref:extracellular catalytic domain type 1 short-chain-length polyhydroxyalkanoate depolymerase n=1 Tax=Sphingomonas sp. TaxID=28214 RepID=UPI003563C7C4